MSKAQGDYPIMMFGFVLIALLLFGLVMFKVNDVIGTKFADAMGNQTAQAGINVRAVTTTFNNFWDFVIVFAFVINILLLFISSFMVETHPVFLVVYIVAAIILFIISPSTLEVVNQIAGTAGTGATGGFAQYESSLPMLWYLKDHFAIILLSLYFLSGLIMYAKYRMGQQI